VLQNTINVMLFNGKLNGEWLKLDENEMRFLSAFVIESFKEHSYKDKVLERATMVDYYKQSIKKFSMPKKGKVKIRPHQAIALYRLLRDYPIDPEQMTAHSIYRQVLMDKIHAHYHYIL